MFYVFFSLQALLGVIELIRSVDKVDNTVEIFFDVEIKVYLALRVF